MTTAMQRSILTISCALVLCFAVSGLATATQIPGWWGGLWTCNVDGRPARMKWIVVQPGVNMCDDDGSNCIMNDRLRWKGGFSDGGSRWGPLTNPREGKDGGLFFHSYGDQWYLPKPKGNKTTGWTTWKGQHYPLSCWR